MTGTHVDRAEFMSSKLFRSGASSRARGASTGSAGELTAQNKEIIEFDHRFDARISDHAPGALPLRQADAGPDRNVAVVLKKYEMELLETQGVREEVVWRERQSIPK